MQSIGASAGGDRRQSGAAAAVRLSILRWLLRGLREGLATDAHNDESVAFYDHLWSFHRQGFHWFRNIFEKSIKCIGFLFKSRDFFLYYRTMDSTHR